MPGCPHCVSLSPKFDEAAEKARGICKFGKIDMPS